MDAVYFERRGKAPVESYVESLLKTGQRSAIASFEHTLETVLAFGVEVGMPHTRIIDRTKRIYELRFGDHRVAYIVEGDVLVLLHGWPKKSRKLDAQEAATAARYADDWRNRNG